MNYASTELEAMIEQALLEVEMPALPPAMTAATAATPTPVPTHTRLKFDDNLHYTDVDNGNRLIQAFGSDIRYCHEQDVGMFGQENIGRPMGNYCYRK